MRWRLRKLLEDHDRSEADLEALAAIVMTICGASAIATTALGAHTVLEAYLWPANAMIWCWCWYDASRTSRRLRGELDAALLMRRRNSGWLS
jgi:hypothetical protein